MSENIHTEEEMSGLSIRSIFMISQKQAAEDRRQHRTELSKMNDKLIEIDKKLAINEEKDKWARERNEKKEEISEDLDKKKTIWYVVIVTAFFNFVIELGKWIFISK